MGHLFRPRLSLGQRKPAPASRLIHEYFYLSTFNLQFLIMREVRNSNIHCLEGRRTMWWRGDEEKLLLGWPCAPYLGRKVRHSLRSKVPRQWGLWKNERIQSCDKISLMSFKPVVWVWRNNRINRLPSPCIYCVMLHYIYIKRNLCHITAGTLGSRDLLDSSSYSLG